MATSLPLAKDGNGAGNGILASNGTDRGGFTEGANTGGGATPTTSSGDALGGTNVGGIVPVEPSLEFEFGLPPAPGQAHLKPAKSC